MNKKDLQHYVGKFTNLSRHQHRQLGPAPHKPVLLIAVITMIEHGRIQENRITLSEKLEDTFLDFWPRATARKPNIAFPFYHLKGDGFWHHQAIEDRDPVIENTQNITPADLREVISYVYLDGELFAILTDSVGRETLRQALIQEYFPVRRREIDKLSEDVRRTEEYESHLLKTAELPFEPLKTPDGACRMNVRIRSEGFRQVIVKLYDYTCAVCRLRILTMDDKSASEAFHIIPFEVSHNHDIRNGISLCPLHGWAFGEGLISLNDKYQLIVSDTLSRSYPTEWTLTELQDKPLQLPETVQLWPAQEAIEWHRKYVFRRN